MSDSSVIEFREGNVVCPACDAVIAWECETPDDCLRCGAPFPTLRPSKPIPQGELDVSATT